MSEFSDFMTAGLGEVQGILGTVPFFWSGAKYQGDFSKLDESYEVEDGGRQLRVTATLYAARAQFTAVPKKGQRVKVGADAFEIAHVDSDFAGVSMFLAADIRRAA